MKLAYIILSHKNPEYLFRLFSRLNCDNTVFVIHVSLACEKGFYKKAKELFKSCNNVFFCKREDGSHYEFGIVQGIINALDLLFRNNIDFDYVNLLSGQDYPIKSNDYIKEFFKENYGKQFIRYWPMNPEPQSEFYRNHPWGDKDRQVYRIDRYTVKISGKRYTMPETHTYRFYDKNFYKILKIYFYEFFKNYRENKLRDETIKTILCRILPFKRKLIEGYEFYGGKTWWSATRELVKLYLDYHNSHPKLKRFYKYTLIPDEMYLQTIVMNSKYKNSPEIVNNMIREEEMKGGGGNHPIIFKKGHFERLKNSPNLFARKFDASVDSEILDLIDRQLLKV